MIGLPYIALCSGSMRLHIEIQLDHDTEKRLEKRLKHVLAHQCGLNVFSRLNFDILDNLIDSEVRQ